MLFLLAPAPAGALELAFPLDCTLGESCFIQQYMDRDPGPGAQDFTCGPLSYEGHEGTDFALPSFAAMQAGVTVRAAAPGIVKGTRDAMADIVISDPAAPPLDGRDCGNGVVIDHGGGWETQYCHMKRGSIAVRSGQTVETGTPLGEVGLSGRTEFPHLHVSVRKDGAEVDPFDPDESVTCTASAPPLWQPELAYVPGGVIAVGISTEVPEYAAIKAGLDTPPVLPAKAPALVVWAYLFGPRTGDRLELAITGPEGEVMRESVPIERTQAQSFRAIGKRLRGPAGWPAGDYGGSATLMRDGAAIGSQAIALRIEG